MKNIKSIMNYAKLNDDFNEQKEARLNSMIEILSKSYKSVSDLLHDSLEESIKLTDSKIGFIFKYDEDKELLSLFCWSDKVAVNNKLNSISGYVMKKSAVFDRIISERRTIIINDKRDIIGCPVGHIRINKFMGVPVFSEDKIVAILGVANKLVDYTLTDSLQLRLLLETVWKKVEMQITNEKLRASEEKYRLLHEYMSEGQIYNEMVYDENGKAVDYIIIEANRAYAKAFNFEQIDLRGKRASEIFGQAKPPYLDIYSRVVSSGQSEQFEAYISQLNKYFSISVYTLGGNKFAAIFFDISIEKIKHDKMLYITYHDALTGTFNRMYFEEEIKKVGSKYKLPVSIILGDVNGLKITNDVFGHQVGDKLLKRIARILKNSCRKEDVIARWGGDEFIILLPEADSEVAELVCKNIRAACQRQTKLPVNPSISLGYATKTSEACSIQKTIKSAEDWMYRHKLLESKSIRSAVISSLNKTLFEKSLETEEHGKRLAAMCRKIGEELNLSERLMDSLELISTLHDIGKIPINDYILLKPSPLTEKEWHEMKKHPEIGYRIAQSIPELTHVADGILSHHERWDGTGYPQQLKKTQIPLLARIVAVVDAYDAMTNTRPYREKISHEQALEEIKKGSGTQFDPHIVEVFIKCFRDRKDVC